MNNCDGTFTFYLSELRWIAGADIIGDGKVDLLIPNALPQGQSGCQTAVTLGNGDGTFGPIINVPPSDCYPFSPFFPSYYPLSPAYPIADMNGDGRPDIVFLWGPGVGVLFNTTPPGFGLSASTLSPATVTAGDSATSTITVVPILHFSQAVTLACSGLPSGASCVFDSPSIAGSSGTSALTISTSASLAAGTYVVQDLGRCRIDCEQRATITRRSSGPRFYTGCRIWLSDFPNHQCRTNCELQSGLCRDRRVHRNSQLGLRHYARGYSGADLQYPVLGADQRYRGADGNGEGRDQRVRDNGCCTPWQVLAGANANRLDVDVLRLVLVMDSQPQASASPGRSDGCSGFRIRGRMRGKRVLVVDSHDSWDTGRDVHRDCDSHLG